MTQNHRKSDLDHLRKFFDSVKIEPPPGKISEYVEGHRVLPQDTPYPGPWQNSRTPYLVEIMDCFSPSSPIQNVAVMKGAQLGLTTAGENILGYFMDVAPAPIMVMSSTDDAAKAWGEIRLDPMLDSLQIRDKFQASNEGNKKSRKTGDTSSKKIFPGGYLVIGSARSASGMRSYPIRIMFRDEIDGAPTELTTGEGNWLSVSEARTNSQEAIRKIFDISTPTTFQNSNIYRQYLKGDQRKLFVPCPHCDEFQELEMGNSKTDYGLKPIFDEDGVLEQAYYECRHCHEPIYNHHKIEMLNRCEWRSTATAKEKFYQSYHISSLYSPYGFLSWRAMYQKYHNGRDNEDERRSFVNLYLGLPYKERGLRPNVKKVIALIQGSTYNEGQVPQEVIFLTMAIDVQTGKNSRLAIEICGHGDNFKTASIIYREIKGAVDNPSAGAWKELKEWCDHRTNPDWGFKRKDGVVLYPKIVGIDSGDGNTMATVYGFCRTMAECYPLKGFNNLKSNRKNADVDEYNPAHVQRFAQTKYDGNHILLKIATVQYKEHIYHNLNIERPDDGSPLPSGFCDFPMDRGGEYFQMLTAEEKLSNGNFDAGGRRNESLDVRVYNLGLGDFYISRWMKAERAQAIKNGESELEVRKKYDHAYILGKIEKKNTP